ncbi:MAG: 7TM-DISM domain-containing protein [Polyangiales bacterium]
MLRLLRVILIAVLMGSGARARAEALDVSGPLSDVALGMHVEVLEDATRALSLEQVLHSDAFRASHEPTPGFGFTRSVYWLRLVVKNTRAEERAWLLELGYPLLDDVTLFTPREGGFDARRTGDMRPFAQRDIAYRNFVFSLREPARGERVYYLRVQSSSSMSLPLSAWSLREFVEHQHHDWTMLCIFYGVLLAMTAYSLAVYGATKQREYLPYAGYIVSIGVFQFTVAGHTFQYVLPNEPQLVQVLTPLSVVCAIGFAALVARTCFPGDHALQKLARLVAQASLVAVPLAVFVPYAFAMPVVVGAAAGLLAVVAIVAARHAGDKDVRLFLVAWAGAIAGAMWAALAALGVVPVSFLGKWSVQLGVTVQLVMLSSAYADKYNAARVELSAMQARLSQKVNDLSAALARAEEASDSARQATRSKNEFMATMSHEFRTPLNPIINIPQGVRQEFEPVERALCTGCNAHFELDEGDHLDGATACPECGRVGTLEPRTGYRFRGDAARAKALIAKVEHSGRHLLTVVNGILDFSKMQAGHLELTRERVSVAKLFAELERTVRAQAAQRRLQLSFELPDGDLALDADPVRALQVLVCLTDNALKYSEAGGSVEARGPSARVPIVVVRAVRVGVSCAFSVRDQGIGIARENLERIFQSFEQVHKGNTRKYGGTGLGLSIARALVQMHGGELRVESELGQGSTFRFELALASADAQVKSA